jgi:hypothetical protein
MNEAVNDLDIYFYVSNTLITISSLLCILFSLLVIYICLTRCDRKATEIVLISIFCSLEAVNGLGYAIYGIIKFIFGYKISESGSSMCLFSAFFLCLFNRFSIIGVSVLAALRYLIVCRKKELKLWKWLLILAIPSLSLTVFYSLVFYTNDAYLLTSKITCAPFSKRSGLSDITLYLIPFYYIIPCWTSTYCYFMVGWVANKQLNLMKQEAVNNSDEDLLATIKNQKLKLCMQIIFVFVIYNVNFILSYVTWIMKLAINYKRTFLMDTIIQLQVTSTAFLNPLVTVIFQPDINNEFKFLWVKFKLRLFILFRKIFNQ